MPKLRPMSANHSHSSASGTSALKRYSAVAMLLHWLLAVALVAMFALGIYMTDLPFSPARLKLYNWHKWAGMTVLALSVLRLLWRLTHPAPALPVTIASAMPAWQRMAHHSTHHALYLLFFAVPVLGWVYSSAAGFPVVVFGMLPLPDLVAASPELADTLKPLHKLAALAMGALVLMHVGAAVKHQLIDRDGLMHRMLPGRKA